MTLLDALVTPYLDYGFMRRALVACFALAIACGPVGVILVLRRMSLVGDAMSHAVLPGAAVAFLIAGFSLLAMSFGGMLAGLAVALLAGIVSRTTPLREDASFAAFYLISLAAGIMIVSIRGSNVDLLHILFGTILAVDDQSLLLVGAIASATLIALAAIYRPLIAECFDPTFLRSVGGLGGVYHAIFLVLVVLVLVAGFQALGTLMAVGLMMLPAAAARFWARQVWSMAAIGAAVALVSGYAGLLLSFHFNAPSGPAIVMTAGAIYLLSVALGPQGGLKRRLLPRPHLEG
jgi:zinc/manganese transport system permease protein